MPAISKIRLTNVIYEDGGKRFNDELFRLDGHNAAFILENGGGKTVLIHTVLQAILPHTHLGERKIKDTLQLDNAPAHIGIEWIYNDKPRRYVTTAISLFLQNNQLHSYKYVYEYDEGDSHSLEHLPFAYGSKRPASRHEIADYYSAMKAKSRYAHTFETISSFHDFIEQEYDIVKNEWESVVKINRDEGGIEGFFQHCKTTTDLYDRLLIPTVEDSIAGHTSHMFANMFEKQRDGLKAYRRLQNTLKENKKIQTELNKYVLEFENFSKQKDTYEQVRARAKGLFILLNDDRHKLSEKEELNEAEWSKWQADEKQARIENDSLRIAKRRIIQNELEQDHHRLKESIKEIKKQVEEKNKQVNTLKYSKLKIDLQTKNALLDDLNKQINKEEQAKESDDYKAALEIERAKLSGYYVAELKQFDKALNQIKSNLFPLNDSIEQLQEKIDKDKRTAQSEQSKIDKIAGNLQSDKDKQSDLEQKLLANPAEQRVKDEFNKWVDRFQFLDDTIIQLQHDIRETNKKINKLEDYEETAREEINDINIKLTEQKHIIKEQEKAHSTLIDSLTHIDDKWKTSHNLYLKESSLKNEINDLTMRLNEEREDLLRQERLAFRYLDDHEDKPSYFSNAFLTERIKAWNNDFYVMTGTEFFASLPEEEKDSYRSYTLWPLTIVTEEAKVSLVKERLTRLQDQLQFPVIILTFDHMKNIHQEDTNDIWVAPTHWKNNLDATAFLSWKDMLNEAAKEVKQIRRNLEEDISRLTHTQKEIAHFFSTYPAHYVEEITESISNLNRQKEQTQRHIEMNEKEIEQLNISLGKNEQNLANYKDEKNGLDVKIEGGKEYFKIERHITRLVEQEKQIEGHLLSLKGNLTFLQRQLEDFEIEKESLIEDERYIQSKMEFLMETDDYKAVKKYKPRFTSDTKDTIISRMTQLTLKLNDIEASYGELKVRKEYIERDIQEIKHQQESLLLEEARPDIHVDFPVNGDKLLTQLKEALRQDADKLEELNDQERDAYDHFIKEAASVDSLFERFTEDYPQVELVLFDEDLKDVEASLLKRKQKLKSKERFLTEESTKLKRERHNIEQAQGHLDKFQEAHYFNSKLVKEIILSEQERTHFSYERLKTVSEVTEQLRKEWKILQDKEEKIAKEKHAFNIFCQKHITNRRLREAAVAGLDLHTTLDGVLNYEQNMTRQIESSDKYARETISHKDKEVQAFINSIHNHLTIVTDQLRTIPKNTRIRFGDSRPQIFHFTIPEWDEHEGKMKIRENIDWILQQLESDRFKDEHGLEDHGKVRKEIETWLDTRQLLRVVMGEKTMNVSCRKVTNDNKVSPRLTSWEQSNKWSGGEMWSKNMTLFLGILSFIAEKKGQTSSNVERHRAVILDNPFGKASSTHVLGPVFYIAEQLGFQIIALTAHADGKFLIDYFPINYSLKLRSTKDRTKQVMGVEKHLHHAHFQDHHPETMKRLEESEQMELL